MQEDEKLCNKSKYVKESGSHQSTVEETTKEKRITLLLLSPGSSVRGRTPDTFQFQRISKILWGDVHKERTGGGWREDEEAMAGGGAGG